MDIKDRLRDIPGSYDDFVNSTARWMEHDNSIKASILEQLDANPNSTIHDIMTIICNALEIGDPVELVDEDQYDDGIDIAKTSRSSSGRIAML